MLIQGCIKEPIPPCEWEMLHETRQAHTREMGIWRDEALSPRHWPPSITCLVPFNLIIDISVEVQAWSESACRTCVEIA